MKLLSFFISLLPLSFTQAKTNDQIRKAIIDNPELSAQNILPTCYSTNSEFMGCFAKDANGETFMLTHPKEIEDYLKNNNIDNEIILAADWTETNEK